MNNEHGFVGSCVAEMPAEGTEARRTVHQELIKGKGYWLDVLTQVDTTTSQPLRYEEKEEYFRDRKVIENRGKSLAFDYTKTCEASEEEQKAQEKLEILRQNDEYRFKNCGLPPLSSQFDGQEHARRPGDHFLTNRPIIQRTELFRVARKMPKGAHLHLHFNSTLAPGKLFEYAEEQECMYIWSSKPLNTSANLDLCEIQFMIKKEDTILPDKNGVSLFETSYDPEGENRWMKYSWFRSEWKKRKGLWAHDPVMKSFAMASKDWLLAKLVFQDRESHDPYQSAKGDWAKFNGRTRMMKGLFNYEFAFKQYIKDFLAHLAEENIQYAEIRPNFMHTNQIWKNDGEGQLNNWYTMDLIVEGFKQFDQRRPGAVKGLKVIYCTPRSFSPALVKKQLDECLEFKKRWPDFIAGFDLVGEESEGKPLKDFIPQFLEFKKDCRKAGVSVPFLFHCGETLELGGDADGNLIDALLLDSKRIGHGYALARKPYLMAEFKRRNICLEVCPISNEVLGLTSRMEGHAMYDLLANNVHCTVNSDNGTMFFSTLSHDFYQTMIGSKAMNLYGWKQLIEWSIDHASFDADKENERQDLKETWRRQWDHFIKWINTEYDGVRKDEGAKLCNNQMQDCDETG